MSDGKQKSRTFSIACAFSCARDSENAATEKNAIAYVSDRGLAGREARARTLLPNYSSRTVNIIARPSVAVVCYSPARVVFAHTV